MTQDIADELPRKRWWLKPLLVLVLVGVLVAGGMAAYRRYEPARLAAKGREYLKAGDYRNAVLCGQRALQINPLSEAGARLMVEIAGAMNSPAVLGWRQQLVETNAKPGADALALAGDALRLSNPAVARKALEAVPEGDRTSASFHGKAGLTLLQEGRVADAEKHLSEAARLDPGNDLHAYNLATLRIQSKEPAKRAEAAEVLGRLAQGGRLRVQALRGLVTRTAQDGKVLEAIEHSHALLGDEAADFRDRLVHLALLVRAKSPDFSQALPAIQDMAADDADRTSQLLNWMRLHALEADALAWSAQLDAKVLADGAVANARAECLGGLKKWEELKALTGEGNWGAREYLRPAWEARSRRELRDLVLAGQSWQTALAGAQKNPEDLKQLAALVGRWGWKDELRETLWAASGRAAPQWALQILHRTYVADGDTAGALRVAKRTLQLDPANDAARNNVAMLSLLLKDDMDAALQNARTVHERNPKNPDFAATYALALHLHGRTADGLALFGKFSPETLRQPAIAAYYGLLLAAGGRTDLAKEFQELGATSAVLPEEKALLGVAEK